MEKPVNFIEEIVAADLESGKHTAIVTRFPPEPNGCLHIGHAKAICADFGIAQKYGGTCHLRFDDTNPAREDVEYTEAIKRDVQWLGFSWDRLTYASDFFPQMYECAQRLIELGKAYVCDLTADEIKEGRGTLTQAGVESPYRNRSAAESLELFRSMRDGKFADGSRVLRAKIDMASGNMNMRDPVIYRILRAEHHRTGNQWCIYPMYDFAHPLEDAFEGITHSLCSLEFEDHRPFYDWVLQSLEFDPAPRQIEFARLEITRTVMSKRHLRRLVEEGAVDGWDDPRMPTLSGMRRRGYPPEAIRDFVGRVGMAKANSEVDVALLEHCVRENLNATARRVMVVLDPLKVIIENHPKDSVFREIYIENSDFMLEPPPKYYRLSVGAMVRLKGNYIIKCNGVEQNPDGSVAYIRCEYIEGTMSGADESGIKVKGVIQWVSCCEAVDIEARLFDYLFTETGEINPKSMKITRAKAERGILTAQVGEGLQFMRNGYFCKDVKGENVFNEIVSLKESFKIKPIVTQS